jgi:translation initiation factor 2 subunit 1
MYQKEKLPEKNDLIVCTIDKVHPHECFVNLDEYKDIAGVIHTSEMDRRWVRNMKVYLKIGRQLVCKVMDIDQQNRQVNLSIRRVGEGQRRAKLQFWKNEKRADDLLQFFSKKNKFDIEKLYAKLNENIIDDYGGIYVFMLEVAKMGEDILKELKIESKPAHELFTLIQQRIKIPKAEINGELNIHSTKGDGLNAIKKSIESIRDLAKKSDYDIKVIYCGAPKYSLCISADDKKKAERALEEIITKLQSMLGGKSNVEFLKEKN